MAYIRLWNWVQFCLFNIRSFITLPPKLWYVFSFIVAWYVSCKQSSEVNLSALYLKFSIKLTDITLRINVFCLFSVCIVTASVFMTEFTSWYVLCSLIWLCKSANTYAEFNKKLIYRRDNVGQQCHSRSLISVPIKSPYATSCWWIILTYILSCTVFQLPFGSSQSIAIGNGLPLINALVLGNLCKYRCESYIAIFFGLHFVRQYGSSATM